MRKKVLKLRLSNYDNELTQIKKRLTELELDVEIYHSKLKKIKNVRKPKEDQEETEDLYSKVLLPDNGNFTKS